MKPFIRETLERQRLRLHELDALLSAPDATQDMERFRKLTREHAENGALIEPWLRYQQRETELAEARLEAQTSVGPAADHAQHHFLVAAQLTLGRTHDLCLEANGIAKAGVHARQVTCEQGRFVTARARANFDKRRALVVRVFGQQHALQFQLQLRQLGGGAVDFILRHGGHLGVVGAAGQHLLPSGQIRLALLVTCPAAGHRAHLGVLARQGQKLLHVLHDVFTREQKLQLPQTVGIAGKLLA